MVVVVAAAVGVVVVEVVVVIVVVVGAVGTEVVAGNRCLYEELWECSKK